MGAVSSVAICNDFCKLFFLLSYSNQTLEIWTFQLLNVTPPTQLRHLRSSMADLIFIFLHEILSIQRIYFPSFPNLLVVQYSLRNLNNDEKFMWLCNVQDVSIWHFWIRLISNKFSLWEIIYCTFLNYVENFLRDSVS